MVLHEVVRKASPKDALHFGEHISHFHSALLTPEYQKENREIFLFCTAQTLHQMDNESNTIIPVG